MNKFKPISISLSPNVEKDDLKLALNLIMRPWLWKRGNAIEKIENEFKKYLGVKHAISFNSGRSSFYAILEALKGSGKLKGGDEVLIQAFTCNAVPNPILWADLNPVYVDCNEDDFNMSADDLRQKITVKSKAVVVQHTFGMPADMDKIRAICAEFNLLLIEDCAHSLGAEYNGVKVGSQSMVSFFSFSRDKIISSVYGGMATTNDDQLAQDLRYAQKKFKTPNSLWIFQQLLHPILIHYAVLPIYNFINLGKLLLIFSQIFHILSKAVTRQEKEGIKPNYFPRTMPNALAKLALNQFLKLEKFNNKRQKIAEQYYQSLKGTIFKLPAEFEKRKNIFLRFTIKHKNAHEIIYEAWHQKNILLGDWYTTPIAPFNTNLKKIGYEIGSCPNAEYLSKHTLNLPTHTNLSVHDIEKIINFLRKFDEKTN